MQLVLRRLQSLFILLLMFILLAVVFFSSKNAGVRFSAFQHHQQWIFQNPQQYRYVITVSCYCSQEMTEPFVVDVLNQKPVAAMYVSTNAPVVSSYLVQFQTIDGLFQQIDAAFDQRADVATVIYDETLGYPKEIHIDRVFFGRDDEISYMITRFEVLDV